LLNGTPLLDIKPYVPAFDIIAEATSGWVQGKKERVRDVRADDRFSKKNGKCKE